MTTLPSKRSNSGSTLRLKGVVQGVGMRPTVYRIARRLGLCGEVSNQGGDVLIQLWGGEPLIAQFLNSLHEELPSGATIHEIDESAFIGLAPSEFRIATSHTQLISNPGVVPDRAVCPACIRELLDPQNRRFHYPFINCTVCGPRFSIIKTLPWDRSNTAMDEFPLCPRCQSEYQSCSDRRFHAQPNACAECGPTLFYSRDGQSRPVIDVLDAIGDIRKGRIIAVQGLACVHLACDATNALSVAALRNVKRRPVKPLAVMAANMAMIRRYAVCSKEEEDLLCSPAAPIVLLKKHNQALADNIAPNLNRIGFMLANTPLHHLLFTEWDSPLVLSSANLAGGTPITDAAIAQDAVSNLSAAVLLHNRRIVHRLDDSVGQLVAGKPQLFRRARGYVPEAILLPPGFENSPAVLAYGAHLKSCFCLLSGRQAQLSTWIGDLHSPDQRQDYQEQLENYVALFQFQAEGVACDHHPDYFTSHLAETSSQCSGLPLHKVWHHHAHAAAVMAEHGRALAAPPILAIIFDGAGLGPDGSLWGGEFLLTNYTSFERLAYIKPCPLVGGDSAASQPWRCLWSQLESYFTWAEITRRYPTLPFINAMQTKPLSTLQAMIRSGSNSPHTSSAGRLFDAVAAAMGVCFEQNQYEGEAAMTLQALAESSDDRLAYPVAVDDSGAVLKLNFNVMWQALLTDLCANLDAPVIARRFHNGLASAICEMTCQLFKRSAKWQEPSVLLSGGVFQNALLAETCERLLSASGFTVLLPTKVPANDSGLALGQALIAAATQLEQGYSKDSLCV
ncbi:carbamoyltransferase HypF [Zhongshania sp.]|uniref:carbamoyltransferase HypF n=1 Tax=Zhongshania sp. TaxID=1971902 RepID=UPI0035632422